MKRKDRNGIVLRKGESQLGDGRYRYRYTDDLGNQHDVYSWLLRPGDKLPEGKTEIESLREKEDAINKGLSEGLKTWDAGITLNELVEEYIQIHMDYWADSTYNAYMEKWTKHIKPQIGRKKAVKITSNNVYDFYNSLLNADEKPIKISTVVRLIRYSKRQCSLRSKRV